MRYPMKRVHWIQWNSYCHLFFSGFSGRACSDCHCWKRSFSVLKYRPPGNMEVISSVPPLHPACQRHHSQQAFIQKFLSLFLSGCHISLLHFSHYNPSSVCNSLGNFYHPQRYSSDRINIASNYKVISYVLIHTKITEKNISLW